MTTSQNAAPSKPQADPAQEAAFKRELVQLIPHLRAFARTLAGDAASADDLAQDGPAIRWART